MVSCERGRKRLGRRPIRIRLLDYFVEGTASDSERAKIFARNMLNYTAVPIAAVLFTLTFEAGVRHGHHLSPTKIVWILPVKPNDPSPQTDSPADKLRPVTTNGVRYG